jgi:predicted protein tyrosine phosphatase
MKILCICNQGENRSRTAADILLAKGHDVRYDGFFKDRFNEELNKQEVFCVENLQWADKVIIFEEHHEDLLKKYGYSFWGKSYNLDIEDMYHHNQKSLIEIIKGKLKQYELL